jgi:phosphotransferase system HPr (HPr) family protein
MVSRKCATVLTVPQGAGLHARPSALLARTAQRYDAEITLRCGRRAVDGKSMLSILTLGAGPSAEVFVSAEGCDADEALRAIEALFSCSFNAMAFVTAMRQAGVGGGPGIAQECMGLGQVAGGVRATA